MVGMRQLTASIGVAEQGYVEGMHATHGRSSAGGHACCGRAGGAGTGRYATMERALRRLGPCTAPSLAVGFK